MSDFPNNPSIGDRVTKGGITWEWDGTAWIIVTDRGVAAPFVVQSAISTTNIGTTATALAGTAATLPVIAGVKYLVNMWMPYRYGGGETSFVYAELRAGGDVIAFGGEYKTRISNERSTVEVTTEWTPTTDGASLEMFAYVTSGSNTFQTWQASSRTIGYSLTPVSEPVVQQPAGQVAGWETVFKWAGAYGSRSFDVPLPANINRVRVKFAARCDAATGDADFLEMQIRNGDDSAWMGLRGNAVRKVPNGVAWQEVNEVDGGVSVTLGELARYGDVRSEFDIDIVRGLDEWQWTSRLISAVNIVSGLQAVRFVNGITSTDTTDDISHLRFYPLSSGLVLPEVNMIAEVVRA